MFKNAMTTQAIFRHHFFFFWQAQFSTLANQYCFLSSDRQLAYFHPPAKVHQPSETGLKHTKLHMISTKIMDYYVACDMLQGAQK